MMTTIRVSQLIYTNVEAEHSPTNRRGFQVWLCSPKLKDHQREIAKRLEDYDWPTPDADRNHLTVRLVFFRLTTGDFVIARTVPLADRDALRRAGRFHAHAVVVSAEEFATIGNDPFAVVDRFPFHDHPSRHIDAGTWRTGHLPNEESLSIDRTAHDDSELSPAVAPSFPLLVRLLTIDDPRPIALPAPPDQVAAFLRSLFRILPPSLRARASFDTLSTGQSLHVLHYRFAGGYDTAGVRDWPYRRSYRFDPVRGEFATPPETPDHPGLDHLAKAWLDDHEGSDADREDAFHLLNFLHDPQAGEPTKGITDRAFEWVRTAPGIEAGVDRLFRRRLSEDVPLKSLHLLIEEPAREWMGAFSREAVERLSAPIPLGLLAKWFQHQTEQQKLPESSASDLEVWTSDLLKQPGDSEAKEALARLYLIGVRWQSDAAERLIELRSKPGWDFYIDGWFRDWFYRLSALAPWFASPSEALRLAEAVIANSARLPALALHDTEIHLTFPWTEDRAPPSFKPLAFAAAFRRTDATRQAELLADREDHLFTAWVIEQARRLGLSFDFALGEVAGQSWPGLALTMTGPTDPAETLSLFEAFQQSIPARRELLLRGRQEAAYRVVQPIIRPDERLKPAETAYTRENWDRLADRLEALEPGEMMQFWLEHLSDKCQVSRSVGQMIDGRLWIGVTLEPLVHPNLFAGVYGATIAMIKRRPAQSADRIAALMRALSIS